MRGPAAGGSSTYVGVIVMRITVAARASCWHWHGT
jgi:hypothetical protein